VICLLRVIRKEEGGRAIWEEKEDPFIPIAGGFSVRWRRISPWDDDRGGGLVVWPSGCHLWASPVSRPASLHHPPLSPIPTPLSVSPPCSVSQFALPHASTPLWPGRSPKDKTSHLHCHRYPPLGVCPACPVWPCLCARSPGRSTARGPTISC
jgi:hypothetical protein